VSFLKASTTLSAGTLAESTCQLLAYREAFFHVGGTALSPYLPGVILQILSDSYFLLATLMAI
jgi:hypothetical protein